MKIDERERLMMAKDLMAAWIVHHGSSREGRASYSYSPTEAAQSALEGVDALIKAGKSFRWFDSGYS